MACFADISVSQGSVAVLWHCWLGGRKGIRPVNNLSGGVLAWLSVWSELQTCICSSWCHCRSLSLASVKSRLVLPFFGRAHLGSPGKRAVKWVCVATRARCGGIFNIHLTANLPRNLPVKFFKNQLTFDRIMVMSLWLRFLAHPVYEWLIVII